MKNSLRISTFIFALAIIVAGVSSSYASGTRLKSMGMSADTYWMLQKDTGLTAYNPAYYVQFPALITFNEAVSGTTQIPTGMIWFAPMDDLRLVLMGQGRNLSDGSVSGSAYTFQNAPATLTALTARESYNFALSYKMGNMSVGLSYASMDRLEKNSTASGGADTKLEKNLQQVSAGIFMDLGGGMDFDAALKYTMYDYSAKTATVKYSADPSDLDVMARFNMGVSENNRLHLWFRYNPMDRSDKSTDIASLAVTKDTYTISRIVIGISDEVKFTQGASAYFGGTYEIISSEDKENAAGTPSKTTVDKTILVFITGAEAQLTKNLKGRVGITRQWIVDTTTKVTNAAKVEQSDSAAATGTMGLGYQMGHWNIEAQLKRDLLTDGPYFISGKNNTTTGWAAEVNLGYTFGYTAVFDEDKK